MENQIKRLEQECISLMRSNLALQRAVIELHRQPSIEASKYIPFTERVLRDGEVPETAWAKMVVLGLMSGIPECLREKQTISEEEMKRLAGKLQKSCGCSARTAAEQVAMWMRALQVEPGKVSSNKVSDIRIWKEMTEKTSPRMEMSLEELDLSVRAYNSLRRAGIFSVADLTQRTETDIIKIRNLGQRSFREIEEKMAAIGVQFKEELV